MKIREKFPILRNNPGLIYLDNGATTLKPISVIQAETSYLENISANPHAIDYKTGFAATEIITETRVKTAKLINAKNTNEVIFTSGTTHSINQIAFGLKNFIHEKDEILVTTMEHSANLLPWIIVANEKKAQIVKIPLNKDTGININKLVEVITPQTKIFSFVHASNTIGFENDVKKIVQKVRTINPNIIIVVDCAQTIAHTNVDVESWDVDFIAFSAHKMYGPFGLGVLWGKIALLNELLPIFYGGGMSKEISEDLINYKLASIPAKFEAGTPNISAIAAFLAALNFLEEIKIEKIRKHEHELKDYLRNKIKANKLDLKIDFYNLENHAPILNFNAKNVNPQDITHFLDFKYKIASRSGAHCARRTEEVYGEKTSVRISFGVYNTKEEIDVLIEALNNIDKFLDVIF